MIPTFQPSIRLEPGAGEVYEDGRVFGSTDTYVTPDGRKGLVIHEWWSERKGKGCSTQALQWFRDQGYEHIVVNGVGLIEGGVGDISTAYWLHMHAKGLVDVLLDDEGADITPNPIFIRRSAP